MKKPFAHRTVLRLIAFALAVLCLFSFVACTQPTSEDPAPTVTETPSDTPTVAPTENPSPTPTQIAREEEPTTAPLLRSANRVYSYVSASLSSNENEEDKQYVFMDGGNKNSACRFADGYGMIIYKFQIRNCYEPSVSFDVANNYVIEVSGDRKNWTTVVDWMDEHAEIMDQSNYTSVVIDPYQYEIYDCLYVRFSDSNQSNGWGAAIFSVSFGYYAETSMEELNIFDLTEEEYDLLADLIDYNDASPVLSYKIASDGGLIYNPISREKADELSKYAGSDVFTGTVQTKVGKAVVTVKYTVPKKVTAYDALPIIYEITTSESLSQPIYLSATAFENAERESVPTYDLTLPGTVELTWDYLGYVGAANNASKRSVVISDSKKDYQGVYPQYTSTDLICSGNVKSFDTLWFLFRYTNTGNTVLEGDGNGTFCVEPILYKKNGSDWQQCATVENLYYRFIDEVYPGESGEMYVTFNTGKLSEGEYQIVLNGLVRNETSNPENYGKNIWGGETYTTSSFTFRVTAKGGDETPAAITKRTNKSPTRNMWLHRYEEFMTSYDTQLRGLAKTATVNDTMYLQCAPWTNQVVLKLIVGNGDNMATVALPVEIDTDSVKVKFNPDNNNYVVLGDGTRFPAISAQSMADMRGNVQLGPDAAGNILDNLTAMKEIGINLINTTAAFEFDGSYGKGIANNIDACWFSLDAARKLGLKVEGWVTYPYNSTGCISQANSLFGTSFSDASYGSDLATASGLCALWQYLRWGDNYWIGGDNTVVLDIEDSRGWMRVDFNAREPMSTASKADFRIFLMDLYANDIESLNDDWCTQYTSFSEIDPESGALKEAHGWPCYYNVNAACPEWSLQLSQLDAFRTLERIRDYKTLLSTVSETIPTAKINLRTEGANWIATVDPDTDNSHLRHVYYSQRRLGIIPELMANSGVLYAASDYTTLPYTPSEVAELTATSVESGIIPMLLPQFDRMRDIAVNEKYGTDFTHDYNLAGTATKGAYINTVCSVFEWFRATYENGGVPGILWQDYLCDGYATATQRREIAFFAEKLKDALATPEGQKWATQFNQDASVLANSDGLWTFKESDVQAIIDNYFNNK